MTDEARLTDHDFKVRAQQLLADAPPVGSTWRHYNGGLYEVLLITIDEATLAPLVHYRSLTYGSRMTRTLANWHEDVPGHGPRFRPAERSEL